MDSRQSPRYILDGAVTFKGDAACGAGLVLNLSTAGCAIRSETLVQRGDYIDLSVHIPQQEDPVKIDLAAVRWVQGRQFGLEFIRIKREIQEQLRTLLTLEEKPLSIASPGKA